MAQQHRHRHRPPACLHSDSWHISWLPFVPTRTRIGRQDDVWERKRYFRLCISSVKENPGVGHKPSKRFAATCWQDSRLRCPEDHDVFPDPSPEKPQEVPPDAQVGFPVWPSETWERAGS